MVFIISEACNSYIFVTVFLDQDLILIFIAKIIEGHVTDSNEKYWTKDWSIQYFCFLNGCIS